MAKADPNREARLAEALRHNLRRRKAQAREQPAEEAVLGELKSTGEPSPR